VRDSRLRRWLAILVFFVAPFGPTVALAQESRAGVVTTVEGQALLARPTLTQPVGLKFKDDLFARDRIETKEDSIVRVLLGGKAVVTIRELSVFTVTEEPGRAALDLRSGKLAVGVARSLLRAGEVVEIRTPNAVAGIRGSLLVAEVAEVGGVPQSAFTALQATVPISIASLANPNLTVSLSPNQTVSVAGVGAAATFGPVLKITPAQAQRAAATAAAPRQAGQATTSLLDSQMTATQVAQAAELASLIAPASQSTLTTAGVVSVEPTPSTAQLGVNETEAGVVPPVVPPPVEPDVPDITIKDTTLDVPPGGTLKTYTGTSSRTGTSPVVLISNSQVSGPGSLLAVAPGADASLNGPLLEMNGPSVQASVLTAGANVVDIQGQLADTTTSALLQFDPTLVVSGNQFARVSNGGNLSLVGPLVSAVGTSFRVGDPTANVFSFLSILDGSTVIGASPSPLLSFDGSSVDTSGNIVSIRRSPSTSAPSTLFLLGPLLSAVNGSSFNTSSLGLGAGCCSVVSVTQGGLLFALTTSPLVQINGSTVNAGPDAQSGGGIINLSDTFTNAPPAELVAPATVFLAGPLLSVDNSTVTALFHLLRVGNSDLISTSPNPLIQLDGSTVSLGGTDPFDPGTSTSGRLLVVVSSGTPGTSASPASVSLAGPVLNANNSTLTVTSDVVGVLNDASLTSTTSLPLLQLGNTALTAGTASINGQALQVSNLGGPEEAVPASVTMNGPLLVASNGSSLNLTGGLFVARDGGQATVIGSSAPFVSITGGTHSIASNAGLAMFRLFGRSTATAVDSETGLILGTDKPLQQDGVLLETSGATVTGQQVARIDTALLAATAPLLNAKAASLLTTSTDAIDLSFRTNVTSLGSDVLRLDASKLNVLAGALVNVAGGSKLTVAGNLVSLTNGATLTLFSGPLLNVSGGSFASITGALVNFGGTGGNVINLTNTLAPTGYLNGVPVFSSLGGTTGFTFTNATPLVGLNSLGAIKINNTPLPNGATGGMTGSLIAIQSGGGTVKVGP
jgi:hypothetical protein